MELTFKRRNHYGITVWESNETVLDCGIEFPRFRITKEKTTTHGGLFVVREKDPQRGPGYHYSSNTVSEKKLTDTIYWLNLNLCRIPREF